MGYIEELRAVTGSRPLILVSAMVLIFDADGQILLVRNKATGAWHVPGGYMEPGESLEDAARRESREECDVEITQLRLFGVFSGTDLFWTYPNGDQVYNVTAAFVAERWTGEPKPDGEEGTELSFFELGRLPESLGPPAPLVLHRFRDAIRTS